MKKALDKKRYDDLPYKTRKQIKLILECRTVIDYTILLSIYNKLTCNHYSPRTYNNYFNSLNI